VFLGAALWLSNIASNFLEARIARSRDLTASVEVLLTKMVRMLLMVWRWSRCERGGIDLPPSRLFSGAIGAASRRPADDVANFIARHPVADKSGEAGDLSPWRQLRRHLSEEHGYISVAAATPRDLIPNEDLVTRRW